MLEFLFSPSFFNSTHQFVSEIIRLATLLMTFAVVIYFIALLFRLSADADNRPPNYHILLVVFTAIGLATYQIWAVWFGKLFVLLARAIFDLEEGNIMSDYLASFFNGGDGTGLRLSLFNIMSLESLSSISYMLVMIIYEVFVIIQVIIQIFFYLLGPLAIVLNLFPNFRGVFSTWLANFAAVNFWSVLAAILFRLIRVVTSAPAFQTAIQSGDKGILWDTFLLGVIIAVTLVLIPKFTASIFGRAGASADLGTYGIGITAGVILSTVWRRFKGFSIESAQTATAMTSAGVKSGTQVLSESPAMDSTRRALQGGGAAFGGATQANTSSSDLQG